MSLPPLESIPADEPLPVKLTALGLVAAHGGAPEQRAVFFVTLAPGNVFVVLRAAGSEAWTLLQRLRQGSRVALVELPAVDGVEVDVEVEKPITEAGILAGWSAR